MMKLDADGQTFVIKMQKRDYNETNAEGFRYLFPLLEISQIHDTNDNKTSPVSMVSRTEGEVLSGIIMPGCYNCS